jgi:hypothetical protein
MNVLNPALATPRLPKIDLGVAAASVKGQRRSFDERSISIVSRVSDHLVVSAVLFAQPTGG